MMLGDLLFLLLFDLFVGQAEKTTGNQAKFKKQNKNNKT